MATAMDFARLAYLMIDGTNLKKEQIISQEWIKDTYTTDTTFIPLDGYGNYNLQCGMYYNNFWWPFYNKETKETTALLANGLYWQFLYIHPEKNLVIVRMGDEGDNY
jgi:CubicO group peptidase (beta-lactamase class C family)